VGSSIGTVLEGVRTEIDSAIEDVLARITIEDVMQRLKPQVGRPEVRHRRAAAN
jgi:DNA-binding IscR family transcriptional regulator